MTRITNYRVLSLLALVAGTIGLFVGFFFVWMIAPVVAIAAFYLVFFFNEERGAVGRARRQDRRLRRERLTDEAQARRADLTYARLRTGDE